MEKTFLGMARRTNQKAAMEDPGNKVGGKRKQSRMTFRHLLEHCWMLLPRHGPYMLWFLPALAGSSLYKLLFLPCACRNLLKTLEFSSHELHFCLCSLSLL